MSKKIIEKTVEVEGKLNRVLGNDILKLQGKIYGFGDSSPIPRIGSLIPFSELTKIISPRLLLFIAYLFLDITRLGINSSGNVPGRKMVSILLAVLDVVRDGDYKWQKAFLSLIGYMGSNQLLVGELLKVFLTIFEKAHPHYQGSVIDNIPCILKSIIAGSILEIVRLTATENIGNALDSFFDSIEKEKIRQNAVADKAGIGPRPDNLVPTFRDINNLQVVFSDKAYLKSCSVVEAIKKVNNLDPVPIPIKFLFFIFDVEMDNNKLDDIINNNKCKTYPISVTKEMVKKPVSEKAKELISQKTIQSKMESEKQKTEKTEKIQKAIKDIGIDLNTMGTETNKDTIKQTIQKQYTTNIKNLNRIKDILNSQVKILDEKKVILEEEKEEKKEEKEEKEEKKEEKEEKEKKKEERRKKLELLDTKLKEEEKKEKEEKKEEVKKEEEKKEETVETINAKIEAKKKEIEEKNETIKNMTAAKTTIDDLISKKNPTIQLSIYLKSASAASPEG